MHKARQILENLSPERRAEIDKHIKEELAFNKWLEETDQVYGTPTSHSLKILSEHNFKPVGITWLFGEETFIFETEKEASEAYTKMERELSLVIGWFYSRESFEKEDKEYCSEVFWI